jgi:peptide chain release factor 1
MLEKLGEIEAHFRHLEEQMTDPEILSNIERYTRINKEYKDLQEIIGVFTRYKNVLSNIKSAKHHLNDPDKEMREMAEMELESLEQEQEELEEKLRYLLIPKDPDDTKDVLFEIRAGTGGDEAAIFAGDLYRMYSKYFETQGWKQEILQLNEGTVGGFSKIVLEVSGHNVYGKLKFESGAHRVQRVPVTETQGRVHTSAATVVVMPKLEMEDVDIKKSDLKIDTFRSSGAGGQHVNKTESGVRFTHLPTGIVAESTDGRSQIKNREIAIQRLYQKIYESQRQAYESEQASRRRSLVGTGDRSDKIRTYNYPQNRVTDHRINLTLYNLDRIMEGDLETILEGLQVAENAEKLKGEVV